MLGSTVNQLIDSIQSSSPDSFVKAIVQAQRLLERRLRLPNARDAIEESYPRPPESLARLDLTDDKARRLDDALLDIRETPAPVGGAAAFALKHSDRLDALPKLAEMAKRWAPVRVLDTKQAVCAIEDIILSVREHQPLTASELVAIVRAQDALDYVVDNSVKNAYAARLAAEQALQTIRRWRQYRGWTR